MFWVEYGKVLSSTYSGVCLSVAVLVAACHHQEREMTPTTTEARGVGCMAIARCAGAVVALDSAEQTVVYN